MTVAWADVTAWTTLWAPDDGEQITAAILAQLQDGAAKGATLYSSDYSFTDEGIATVMASWGVANQENRYLFDSSCYFDSSNDKAAVTAAIAGLRAGQWGIGTSSVSGQILHSKIKSILYPDGTGWTFSGSFNESESAQVEFNVVDFIWSRSRAEAFAGQIAAKLQWVLTNEPTQPPTQAPHGW